MVDIVVAIEIMTILVAVIVEVTEADIEVVFMLVRRAQGNREPPLVKLASVTARQRSANRAC